jgi:hypothetical protein
MISHLHLYNSFAAANKLGKDGVEKEGKDGIDKEDKDGIDKEDKDGVGKEDKDGVDKEDKDGVGKEDKDGVDKEDKDGVSKEDKAQIENGYDDESEEGEDFAEAVTNAPMQVDAVVFRKLIMGFVAHFSAKHVLERHAMKLPPNVEVEFKLIAMSRSKTAIGSWDYMKSLIHRAVVECGPKSDSSAMRSEQYIHKIQKHIDGYTSATDPSAYHFIYSMFSKMRQHGQGAPSIQLPDFKGDKHCEAILAAFILYFDTSLSKSTTADNKEFIELQKLRQVFWCPCLLLH